MLQGLQHGSRLVSCSAEIYFDSVTRVGFESFDPQLRHDASLIFSKKVGQDARRPYVIVRNSHQLADGSAEACSEKVPKNVHLLRHLVETIWKIESPEVIIAVTGGATAFDLSSKFKDMIMKGMMDGTRTLKALFITGGTSAGIMRYMGEARAKYNPTAPLIGFASLGPLNTICSSIRLL